MLGRVRLTMTLTNVAVVAVVVVALLLSAFFVAQRVITQNADRELLSVAESLDRSANFRPGFGGIGGTGMITIPAGRFGDSPRIDFGQFERRDPPIEFSVFDANGEMTAYASELPDVLPLVSDVQAALTGKQQISTVKGDSGSLRVVTQPIMSSTGTVLGVVQVSESREAQDQILATLRNVLLVVGGAGLAFSAGAGYLLTGRTMRPVDLAFERQKAFVADAAHEFRTPLAIISANAEALDMASDMPQADRELLAAIQTESTYMAALISKLLEMARLDFEEQRARDQVIDLSAVVAEACEAVEPLAGARHVSVVAPVNESPVRVTGDPVLIRLIVLSLLDNAIKYDRDGGTVTVDIEGVGQLASVRIRDTGPGIPPEHIDRVFDRFYRVDKARSRRTGGAGLGLAIARRAAEVIDGQLSLTSDETNGTVATVRFRRSGA